MPSSNRAVLPPSRFINTIPVTILQATTLSAPVHMKSRASQMCERFVLRTGLCHAYKGCHMLAYFCIQRGNMSQGQSQSQNQRLSLSHGSGQQQNASG